MVPLSAGSLTSASAYLDDKLARIFEYDSRVKDIIYFEFIKAGRIMMAETKKDTFMYRFTPRPPRAGEKNGHYEVDLEPLQPSGAKSFPKLDNLSIDVKNRGVGLLELTYGGGKVDYILLKQGEGSDESLVFRADSY